MARSLRIATVAEREGSRVTELARYLVIEARHEYFQAPGPGVWNDSHVFTFFDESNDIEVFCKVGVLPNQGRAHSWLTVSKCGRLVDCDFAWDLPLPAGDIDDLRIGAYRIQLVEPLKTFRISVSNERCEIKVLWEAVMPVFDYRGAQALADKVAPNHYQQAGHVTGEVAWGGTRYEVKGYGFRDRSWGERDFSSLAEYKAIQGQAGRDFSFMAMKFRTKKGPLLSAGYIYDGKVAVGVAHMDVRIDSLEFGRPSKKLSVALRDEAGREHKWNGETVGNYGFSFGHVIASHDIVRFSLGQREGWGWLEEGVTRSETIE